AQVRQLDAEPARGVEDGFAGADVDLAAVDEEGLAGGAAALAGHRVDRTGMRDARLAAAGCRRKRGALVVVPVAARLVLVSCFRVRHGKSLDRKSTRLNSSHVKISY